MLGAAAPAAPSCPSECQAIGKTTGFQGTIGKTANPFVVTERGKIVAWSIKALRPTDKQMDFFEDFFGGTPSARLSVLKPIQKQIKQGKPIYKLKSQTPVEELAGFLGTTTTFTLQSPLTGEAESDRRAQRAHVGSLLRRRIGRKHSLAGEPQERQVQRDRGHQGG